MKKVWQIGWNSLLRMARDRTSLMMLLVMPLVLIGILGAALGPMMNQGQLKPFGVLLINEDKPAKPVVPPGTPSAVVDQLPAFNFGAMLQNDVLGSDQAKRWLNVKPATDLVASQDAVRNGKYVAVIRVPATFSADLLAGNAAAIQLFSDAGHTTEASIVNAMVGSFTEAVTAEILAARHLPPNQTSLAGQARESALGSLPQVKEVSAGAKSVSAMQYYAAAMAIMVMLMTGLVRASAMIQERQNGTLSRILISPTSRGAILAGQMLGSIITVMAQFLVLLAGTTLIYRVDWGNWAEALFLVFAFALAVSGIGSLTASLLNDDKAAGTAVGVVGNLFAALSGAMFPLYLFPPALKLVAHGIPNYWALQAFLNQMAGTSGFRQLLTPVAVLTAIGLVTGALGTWRLAKV